MSINKTDLDNHAPRGENKCDYCQKPLRSADIHTKEFFLGGQFTRYACEDCARGMWYGEKVADGR